MREGTTSRVMAANRPYGAFYDFLQRQSGIFWIDPRISNQFYLTLLSLMTCIFISFIDLCKEETSFSKVM
jgi:hypothetical protein